ncbi:MULTISPECIES: response regulator transcription factor [Sphingobacterium]|uniref:response regulator transcription factor n=1 Tax=Sphingobacterium TaxID=28453 RepID=UPI0010E12034|nr:MULTISPECIES: helix-turn-helix transcriptional regulator [Sphingobacterium]MCW2262227.1 DNA-binding CsgD family transcriptional regulator [Sphingobacterium kitahiroshimense]TCR13025.1 regulatory LuxR family protein [Sphingobacterium sp. JUb78]
MSLNSPSFHLTKLKLDQQLHGVQKNLKDGAYPINDLGSILPASVMMHDMQGLQPLCVSYMNNWGCERLGISVDEINALGEAYYSKYFIKEESKAIFEGVGKYLQQADFDKQYNFFQRVKLYQETDYKWFYSVCKLIKIKTDDRIKDTMIMLASPVEGIDLMISRVNKVLDEDIYIKNNYRIFASLTKREKTIITMIANGKSSKEMADELFISIHTINTHRKNIINKIGCNSFAALLKFAIAFELL